MSKRFFAERIPPYKQFYHLWHKPGSGRFHKRRLNKAWRRYYRLKDRGLRARMPVHLISEVNMRGW